MEREGLGRPRVVVNPPAVHPEVARLAFLLGRWVGEGTGTYPTIAPFSYREEVVFSHFGKPFLAYSQRTWSMLDGRALHAETGYWRAGAGADGHVELVLAHPTGVVEVEEGTLDGQRLALSSTLVGRSGTAKEVLSLQRFIAVDEDVMTYTLLMAAVGQPAQQHLSARLERDRREGRDESRGP